MIFNDMIDYIISIIIGIAIGIIFGLIVLKPVQFIGPDSNKIITEIHIDQYGKKYKWIPNICICPINYSMDKLSDTNFKESHEH